MQNYNIFPQNSQIFHKSQLEDSSIPSFFPDSSYQDLFFWREKNLRILRKLPVFLQPLFKQHCLTLSNDYNHHNGPRHVEILTGDHTEY